MKNHRYIIALLLVLIISIFLSSCEIFEGSDEEEKSVKDDVYYTLSYDGNGSTKGQVPAEQNFLDDSSVQVAEVGNLEKENYSFIGWSLNPNGIVQYKPGSIFTGQNENVILYAIWTALPVYSVTYESNGADFGNVPLDNNAYTEDSEVVVLGKVDLVKIGYAFIGWNYEITSGDGLLNEGQKLVISDKDIILKAMWQEIDKEENIEAFTFDLKDDEGNVTAGFIYYDSEEKYYLELVQSPTNIETMLLTMQIDENIPLELEVSGDFTRVRYKFSTDEKKFWIYLKAEDNAPIEDQDTFYVAIGEDTDEGAVLHNSFIYKIVNEEGRIFSDVVLSEFIKEVAEESMMAGSSRSSASRTGLGVDGIEASLKEFKEKTIPRMLAWMSPVTGLLWDAGNASYEYINEEDDDGYTEIDRDHEREVAAYQDSLEEMGGQSFIDSAFESISNKLSSIKDSVKNTTDVWLEDFGQVYEELTGELDLKSILEYKNIPLEYLNKITDSISDIQLSDLNLTEDELIELINQVPDLEEWQDTDGINIIYHDDGAQSGSVPIDSTNYRPNQTTVVIDNFGSLDANGKLFIGWNTSPYSSSVLFEARDNIQIGSTDIHLYPVWLNVYSITYNDNGASGGNVPVEEFNYEEGSEITIKSQNTLTRDDYLFLGWSEYRYSLTPTYLEGETFIVDDENIVLYAIWKKDLVSINYHDSKNFSSLDGKSYNAIRGYDYNIEGFNLYEPGWKFLGWATQEDGDVVYSEEEIIGSLSSDLDLYAVYEDLWPSVVYHANSLDANGVMEAERYNPDYNLHVEAVNFTHPSKVFLGWAETSNGEIICEDDYYILAAEIPSTDKYDLYAQWGYEITFNGNGHTTNYKFPKVSALEGQPVEIPKNFGSIRKDDGEDFFVFDSWNTKPDGTGQKYYLSQEVTLNENIELFVIWRKGYNLGDIGPAGGTIVRVNRNYIGGGTYGGYQYLYVEAAPYSTVWTDVVMTSVRHTEYIFTGSIDLIDTPQKVTELIAQWNDNNNESGCAAQLCRNFVYGGYSDWVLSDSWEIEAIQDVLYDGGYLPGDFWTDGIVGNSQTWFVRPSGRSETTWSAKKKSVWAVRRF